MGNIDRKIDYRELYWLGTESLGRRPKAIEGSEDFALGLITIGVDSGNITDFQEYWNGIVPNKDNNRNVWFQPFWEDYFQCKFNNNKTDAKECPSKVPLSMSKIFSKIKPVMNAVYAFATALQDLKNDLPEEFSKLSKTRYPGNLFFNKYLSKVKMNGIKLFDEAGDFTQPKYNIYQYQQDVNGKTNYKEVGNWYSGILNFQTERLKWPLKGNTFTKQVPTSYCLKVCMSEES